MIKLVIADDHAIVREGIKRILSLTDDLQVMGEAANGAEVMQHVRSTVFDVLILDLSMPGRTGIELIKLVHCEKPRLRILVLSMHEELQYAVRAIKSGASGYLTKDSAPSQLIHVVRKIAGGGVFISADVAEQLATGAVPGTPLAAHEKLSDREFEVFRSIADGISVTDIARRLSLSAKTISTHKANLMHKMGFHNQSELIRYAIRMGVTEPLEP